MQQMAERDLIETRNRKKQITYELEIQKFKEMVEKQREQEALMQRAS